MAGNTTVGNRILAAHARHCEQIAQDLAAARASGASQTEIDDLEAQELAARKHYQELAVDMPGGSTRTGRFASDDRRPWWRFW